MDGRPWPGGVRLEVHVGAAQHMGERNRRAPTHHGQERDQEVTAPLAVIHQHRLDVLLAFMPDGDSPAYFRALRDCDLVVKVA